MDVNGRKHSSVDLSLTALVTELHSSRGVAELRALVQAALDGVVIGVDDLIGEHPSRAGLPSMHQSVSVVHNMRSVEHSHETSLILPVARQACVLRRGHRQRRDSAS